MVVGALLRLVEPPVHAVDEEVAVAAARVGLAHVALGVALERLGDERVAHPAPRLRGIVGPRIVLRAAKVHAAERRRPFVAEERELHALHAVFAAEEEAQGMLGVAGLAARRAADAQAHRREEFVDGPVYRVDLLHHSLTLPGQAAS